jgi:NAD(P)-dependent dehydrogenase (short-subunit alcohol dehydrogenase family)
VTYPDEFQVAVVGGPGGPAAVLADSLRELGTAVVELPAVELEDLRRRFRAAAPIDQVIWAPNPGSSAIPTPLLNQDELTWDAGAAAPLRAAVTCFQAALEGLVGGGSIVALLPTIAMQGAPGLTAWATASEGLRSLVKVAAREYGKRGITVNAVALPAAALAGVTESLNRPGLPVPQRPAPTDAGDAAGIALALAGAPWTAVSGATIALDGGVWMPA